MKKILILAAAAAVLCSCGNKNKYTVEGTVAGANDKVYLLDEEDTVLDSAVVKNGKFRLSGIAEAPAVAILRDARDQGATFAAMLILEPGRITVSDDAENAYRKKVTGTPANDASDAYAAASHALVNEFRDEATGEERRAAIEKEYDQLTRTTMEQNRTNLFGALLLAQQLGYELSGQELLDEIALFPEELQRNSVLESLKESAEQKIRTDVGQPYTDVAQPDAEGQEVSLKSVVENPANKYVLLDFWASWCGPCISGMNRIKQLYETYRAAGLEVIGVSLDSRREAWLRAIEKEGLPWSNISNLDGWQTGFDSYGIQSLPSFVLIRCSDGQIVARKPWGRASHIPVGEIEKLLGQ